MRMIKEWHIYVIIVTAYATNKKYIFERCRENDFNIVNLKIENLDVIYIFFFHFMYLQISRKNDVKVHVRYLQWLSLDSKTG